MIKINKEVSLGTVFQIFGYIIMVIYFTAQIQGNLISLQGEMKEIKSQVKYLQGRIDSHIDKGK